MCAQMSDLHTRPRRNYIARACRFTGVTLLCGYVGESIRILRPASSSACPSTWENPVLRRGREAGWLAGWLARARARSLTSLKQNQDTWRNVNSPRLRLAPREITAIRDFQPSLLKNTSFIKPHLHANLPESEFASCVARGTCPACRVYRIRSGY